MQTLSPSFFSFIVLIGLTFHSHAAEKVNRFVVSAGDLDRRDSVVTFKLPTGAAAPKLLRDAEGRVVPTQSDGQGAVSFILKQLPKGTMKSYVLTEASEGASSDLVRVSREGTKLKISDSGKPILEYQAEPSELPRPEIKPQFRRGGYIHPVLSPSGRAITDDYPPNHIHHHGIWFPWTKTEFEGRQPDFWNMGESKGRVEFVALGQTWSGPVHGGFTAQHRFVDLLAPEPKSALMETWEVRVYKAGTSGDPRWVFDLVSTQQCAGASPLILPQYHYGGLGFRGNWQWNGKDKTFFLTSEGETDRIKGNETRGRWCHIGGVVDGQLTGIAILCHPDNFRAPQPMRLHPSEPFFCFAPSQLGQWEIIPGKAYVSRYRFVVQDGPPDKAQLDRLWQDYAHPPRVTVEL